MNQFCYWALFFAVQVEGKGWWDVQLPGYVDGSRPNTLYTCYASPSTLNSTRVTSIISDQSLTDNCRQSGSTLHPSVSACIQLCVAPLLVTVRCDNSVGAVLHFILRSKTSFMVPLHAPTLRPTRLRCSSSSSTLGRPTYPQPRTCVVTAAAAPGKQQQAGHTIIIHIMRPYPVIRPPLNRWRRRRQWPF